MKGIFQFQKAQQIPSRRNMKIITPGNITVKLLKIHDKEKILKAARGKTHIMY